MDFALRFSLEIMGVNVNTELKVPFALVKIWGVTWVLFLYPTLSHHREECFVRRDDIDAAS